MMRLSNATTATRARLMALALVMLAALPAAAQLVVYEMQFERSHGFNDRPFVGGYFVAPVTGGTGSFVFTQKGTGGIAVVPVNDGGRLFRAVTDKGEVKWVAQAQVGGTAITPPPDEGSGTGGSVPGGVNDVSVSTGSFLATGSADFNATLKTPLVTFESRIARTLKGRTISANSEPINESTTRIGFASRGDWILNFDARQSRVVNRQDMDLSTATDYLESLLTGGAVGPVDTTLRINSASPLPDGTVGTSYSQSLLSSGGTGTRTWSLATLSTLPAGLTLTPAGLLSGTPTTQGNFTFTLVVTDSATTPLTISKLFSLRINPALTITTVSPLPAAATGNPYAHTLTVVGSTGTVTWSLNPGSPALPDGLTLNPSTGQITGTPTLAGTSNFTVRATDSGPPSRFTTANFSLTVSDP